MKNVLYQVTLIVCCFFMCALPSYSQHIDNSAEGREKIEQAQENVYLANSNFSYEFGQSLVYFGGGVALFGAAAFVAEAIVPNQVENDPYGPKRTSTLPILGTIGVATGGAIALIGGVFWWVGKSKLTDNGGLPYLGDPRGFSARFDLAGSLFHPISIDMVYGYNFNDYLFLGAGAGARFFNTASIPLYGEFNYSILKRRVTPYIGLRAGAAFDVTKRTNGEPMAAGYFAVDLGTKIRHREKNSGKGDWKVSSYLEGYINRDVNFGVKLGYSF